MTRGHWIVNAPKAKPLQPVRGRWLATFEKSKTKQQMTGRVDRASDRCVAVSRWKIVPENASAGSRLIVNVEPLGKHNYVLH